MITVVIVADYWTGNLTKQYGRLLTVSQIAMNKTITAIELISFFF